MEIAVIEIVANTLGISPEMLSVDSRVGDVPEWDSLAHLTVLNSLEESFGVKWTFEQTLELESIRDILNLLGADRS